MSPRKSCLYLRYNQIGIYKKITHLSPQVKQGWGPLCEFLDVPIPDCPFPRVNDTEEMKRTGR